MAKNEISDYDETDSGNTDISGIGLSDATLIDQLDNIARAQMGAIARFTGADTVAAASTTDIGALPGQYVEITGTTTVTSLGTVRAGIIKFVRFAGALTLTHNATSLILPSSANIVTVAGDTAAFVSEGSGNWRCLGYSRASGQAIVAPTIPASPDFVQGLTLSNNATDASNDIDIATGTAKTGSTSVTNSGVMVKRLDAAWASGTNQGGLDTGSKANSTTYHVHAIRKDSDGAFDALFSLSATAPTVPADWKRIQRLGAVMTDSSGNIRGFVQDGNYFYWNTVSTTLPNDLSTTANRAKALLACSLPTGRRIEAIFQIALFTSNADSEAVMTIADGVNANIEKISRIYASTSVKGLSDLVKQYTNTSAQVNVALVLNGTPPGSCTIKSLGFNDYTIPRL